MSIPTPAALLADLLKHAEAKGAQSAEASLASRESLSIDVRMGALEGVEREEGRSVALRALIGKRQAAATSTDLSPGGLAALAERVVAMARESPEDPFCGLPDPALLATRFPDLGLDEPSRPDAPTLQALAAAAEAAALACPGVSNSAGAGASWSAGETAYATTEGFFAAQSGVSFHLSVVPVAEREGQKERDYESRSVRRFAELPAPETLGRAAGERAAARLGARKVESGRAAVIFESRAAPRLIRPLLGAIMGPSIARGVSFLRGKLGERVFAEGFALIEDPLRPQGLASRSFDGEGLACSDRAIIDDGVLTTWLLNAASARQLGLSPTGHASLGHGGPPGVTTSNLTVRPQGEDGLEGLMRQAGRGLVITDSFSPSLNPNTGDYSVGVSGFWFEDGAIAFPVSEVTIAGTLTEIYARVLPGADLDRRGGLDSPSLLIPDMTIAGV